MSSQNNDVMTNFNRSFQQLQQINQQVLSDNANRKDFSI